MCCGGGLGTGTLIERVMSPKPSVSADVAQDHIVLLTWDFAISRVQMVASNISK